MSDMTLRETTWADPQHANGRMATLMRHADLVTLPPDRDVQPITEGQFAAVVRGFDVTVQEDGTQRYTRDGQPWQYLRKGNDITVRHRHYPLPVRHYLVV